LKFKTVRPETNHITDHLVLTSVTLSTCWTPTRDQFLTILDEARQHVTPTFAVNEVAKQSIIDAGGTILELDTVARVC
jgi:C4-dicarboxylate-binding protein DctP